MTQEGRRSERRKAEKVENGETGGEGGRRKLQARRIYLPSKLKWILYIYIYIMRVCVRRLDLSPSSFFPKLRVIATRDCYATLLATEWQTFVTNFYPFLEIFAASSTR